MTYFHYYATTSRNLDRAVQYGLYPLAHAVGLHIFKDNPKALEYAANFARTVSAAGYSALTSAFFGLESEMIDANSREAVAAEMGIDPSKVQFSDYKYSKNSIVQKAYHDIIKLQKYRYGTDAMFFVPTMLRWGSEACGVTWPRMKDVREKPRDYSLAQKMVNGHNAWDFGVYAGKAVYWAGETYLMEKTGHYEVVKLRENLQSTGKDLRVDDLLAIYQRSRTDRKVPMIENDSAQEHAALRPLLQKMVDAYNKHDGKLGVPEIMYLFGMNKVNIHTSDGVTVSESAVEQSMHEIDKVLSIGLAGIREDNRRMRTASGNIPVKHSKSISDHIADGAFGFAQRVLGATRGSRKRNPEEYITPRDPGELTAWNYSVNR